MVIIPVILLGGSGTRLWPVSRKNHPKQFLNLVGEDTLLQATIKRLDGLENLSAPIVICNEEHRFTTAEQLSSMQWNKGDIILEPVGRNTAPAVAIAALRALQKHEDALLLVLPADHVIQHTHIFQEAVVTAANVARADHLVTFGVVPTKPETGYGYIRRGAEVDGSCFDVAEFVEKPNLEKASEYVASGEYYWNSGMFMFKASAYLQELKAFHPQMLESSQAALDLAQNDLDFLRLGKKEFTDCPADSIDYAVMEKTTKAVTVPLDANWNDVGSWDALWEVNDKDENGNAITGDVVLSDAKNCLVRSENKLVSLVGVENLVVIETKDALLVAAKDKVQDVKTIVEQLRANNRSEAELHQEVYRPWGKYDGVDQGERFQVKRITVNAGESTSLQMHYHRAEHWIIVSGIAEITCGEKVFLCAENESAFIPQGSSHRIRNPGKLPMEMIEVQTGSYLGEDDIVRFDDQYGRSDNNKESITE